MGEEAKTDDNSSKLSDPAAILKRTEVRVTTQPTNILVIEPRDKSDKSQHQSPCRDKAGALRWFELFRSESSSPRSTRRIRYQRGRKTKRKKRRKLSRVEVCRASQRSSLCCAQKILRKRQATSLLLDQWVCSGDSWFDYAPSKKRTSLGSTNLAILCLLLSLDMVASVANQTSNSENDSNGLLNSGLEREIRTASAQSPLEELDMGVLVQTKSGLFRGLVFADSLKDRTQPRYDGSNQQSVIGFMGLRYASAPIRRLRFMPPTAYQYAPNKVHNVQKLGPICRQRWPDLANLSQDYEFSRWLEGGKEEHASYWDLQARILHNIMPKESLAYLRPLFQRLGRREQSEDCLNLNVYVPVEALKNRSSYANSAERTKRDDAPMRPVLVIIHGESFDYGAGSTINGLRFAQQNRLLAITFNYRLNLLGFPPKLVGASRGNLGLMDQVAALHWIKDNIGSFGGSPDNITLMGSKGGAIFVNLLMLSPLAKGLFQRAIMEDGSALTPLVANHISGPPSGAVQHLRLLAKLCDCPIHEHRNSQLNQVVQSPTRQQQQLQQQTTQTSAASSGPGGGGGLLLSADDARANALTFECLRHKQVEMLLQPVPVDLLHLDPASGQLTIGARWLRLLEPPAHSSLIASTLMSRDTTEAAAGDLGELQVPANSTLIRQLVLAAARVQLSPANETISAKDETQQLASDFIDAIYGQPGASLRPLYGPLIDGTIVLDEDIATSMLRTNPTFGQRDLLIGLTQPALAGDGGSESSTRAASAENAPTNYQQKVGSQPEEIADVEPESKPIRPVLLTDRVTVGEKVRRVGLSNEQALEMANLFVRSFYRYHNQEIANSVLNHYLLNAGRQHRPNPRGPQLLVLDSLLKAFQDALINVPLLKTSLIHATRQLDPLIEPFVGQQFGRWLQQHQQHQRQSPYASNETLEMFIAFASSLFKDPSWPLRLQAANEWAPEPQQPKATYLYQFDADSLVNRLKSAAAPLLAARDQPSAGWQSIRDTIASLLIQARGSFFRNHLSFSCALDFSRSSSTSGDEGFSANDMDEDRKEQNENEQVDSESSLVMQVVDSICTQLGSTLGNFVASGNVNTINPWATATNQYPHNESSSESSRKLAERVERYEARCSSGSDHHSVQVSSASGLVYSGVACTQELRSMALSYLIRADGDTGPQVNDMTVRWPVFSLFNQQLVTLPQFGRADLWMVTNVGSSKSQDNVNGPDNSELSNSGNDKWNLVARSSFWSNFIPALNCSRTQPVVPSSLLTVSLLPDAADNANLSRLFSLNLQFSCQQGGKTAYGTVEQITNSINQQLQIRAKRLEQKANARQQPSSNQNHQSLRMANMSDTGGGNQAIEDGTNDQTFASTINDSSTVQMPPVDLISANNVDRARAPADQARAYRYASLVLLICSILLSATLASGAYALIKAQREKQAKRRRSSNKADQNDINADQAMNGEQFVCIDDHQVATMRDQEQMLELEESRGVTNTESHEQQQPYTDPPAPLETTNHLQLVGDVNDFDGGLRTVDANGGFLYWNQANNASNLMTLCRSHSALSMPNGNVAGGNEVQRNRLCGGTMVADNCGLGDLSSYQIVHQEQQPIMMPLLDAKSLADQSSNQYYTGTCHVRESPAAAETTINGVLYADSSSETQVQSSISSTKKRVKISDPPESIGGQSCGTMRRRASNNHKSSAYCPVHREQLAMVGTEQNHQHHRQHQQSHGHSRHNNTGYATWNNNNRAQYESHDANSVPMIAADYGESQLAMLQPKNNTLHIHSRNGTQKKLCSVYRNQAAESGEMITQRHHCIPDNQNSAVNHQNHM